MTFNRVKANRVAALAAGALIAAVLVTGCENPINAGTAASVGSTRISETVVAEQVNAVLADQGKPANTADAKLTQDVIQRLILADLLEQVAVENAIEVTKGDLDATKASFIEQVGGEAELKKVFLNQGVPATAIDSVVRINTLVSLIGAKLAAGGAQDQATQAVFAAIVKKAQETGVDVNPRFGTWDPAQLKLGPRPNDLSVPAAS